MTDVLRFIALAAALGLAAGLFLGGVALLLSAPAHARPTAEGPVAPYECVPVMRRPAPRARLEI